MFRIIRISVIKNSFFEYLFYIDFFDKNLALFVFQCTIFAISLWNSLLSISQTYQFVNTFFEVFSIFFNLFFLLGCLSDNLFSISYFFRFVNTFFEVFLTFLKFFSIAFKSSSLPPLWTHFVWYHLFCRSLGQLV